MTNHQLQRRHLSHKQRTPTRSSLKLYTIRTYNQRTKYTHIHTTRAYTSHSLDTHSTHPLECDLVGKPTNTQRKIRIGTSQDVPSAAGKPITARAPRTSSPQHTFTAHCSAAERVLKQPAYIEDVESDEKKMAYRDLSSHRSQ